MLNCPCHHILVRFVKNVTSDVAHLGNAITIDDNSSWENPTLISESGYPVDHHSTQVCDHLGGRREFYK